ncbi:hypothetical protein EVAR_54012_1 [Eumeta japonica]|uniref:Uncharacterized protein n=1 Tax=Eumeta variegata TaxID=151549 RepID=A0A4C1XSP9_EUMVA|nr:hypothetical protein EVAR_54012_1 [Eumeta japonica]
MDRVIRYVPPAYTQTTKPKYSLDQASLELCVWGKVCSLKIFINSRPQSTSAWLWESRDVRLKNRVGLRSHFIEKVVKCETSIPVKDSSLFICGHILI